jgi:hypothetical protein
MASASNSSLKPARPHPRHVDLFEAAVRKQYGDARAAMSAQGQKRTSPHKVAGKAIQFAISIDYWGHLVLVNTAHYWRRVCFCRNIDRQSPEALIQRLSFLRARALSFETAVEKSLNGKLFPHSMNWIAAAGPAFSVFWRQAASTLRTPPIAR